MASLLESRITALDAETLTPIALQASGCTEGRLAEWVAEPIRPSSGGWGASVIYRFSGSVQAQGSTVPWSAVLKVSSAAIEELDGGQANVAVLEKEHAFYGSDLICAFPTGFRPPRCYARGEHLNEAGHTEYWLWLEDLSPGTGSRRWTTEERYQAAYALGLLSGTFADPGMRARAAWLGGGGIKRYLDVSEPQFRTVFADRSNPLLVRAFPASSVARLVTLWESRHAHLRTLDALPQTLRHGDTQLHNLFLTTGSDGRPEVVAIDWGPVGLGPIGEDGANYDSGAVADLTMSVEQVAEYWEACYERYLAGIRAAGWTGESRLVRLGYTASKIRVLAAIVRRFVQITTNEVMREVLMRRMKAQGATLEDLVDRGRQLEPLLVGWLEESYALRDELL
jgi:hypothetical protein